MGSVGNGNICADRVHIFWDFFLLVGCGSRDKDIFGLFISRMFHLTSKNKTDTCSYD